MLLQGDEADVGTTDGVAADDGAPPVDKPSIGERLIELQETISNRVDMIKDAAETAAGVLESFGVDLHREPFAYCVLRGLLR